MKGFSYSFDEEKCETNRSRRKQFKLSRSFAARVSVFFPSYFGPCAGCINVATVLMPITKTFRLRSFGKLQFPTVFWCGSDDEIKFWVFVSKNEKNSDYFLGILWLTPWKGTFDIGAPTRPCYRRSWTPLILLCKFFIQAVSFHDRKSDYQQCIPCKTDWVASRKTRFINDLWE